MIRLLLAALYSFVVSQQTIPSYSGLGLGIDNRYISGINALTSRILEEATIVTEKGAGQTMEEDYWASEADYQKGWNGFLFRNTDNQNHDHFIYAANASNNLWNQYLTDYMNLDYTTSSFQKDWNALPQTALDTSQMLPADTCWDLETGGGAMCDPLQYPEDLQQYLMFLNKYGTQVATNVSIGCNLDYTATVNTNNEKTFQQFGNYITKIFLQMVAADVYGRDSQKIDEMQEQEFIFGMGGDQKELIRYMQMANGNISSVDGTTAYQFKKWMRSCKDNPVEYAYEGVPISVFGTGTMYSNMEYAIEVFLATSLYERVLTAQQGMTTQATAMGLNCTNTGYCAVTVENGYWKGGGQVMPTFTVGTVYECLNYCGRVAKCATWYTDPDYNCYLLDRSGTVKTGWDGYWAGVDVIKLYYLFYPYRDQTTNSGGKWLERGDVPTWQQCQSWCMTYTKDTCVGWDWDTDTTECYIYETLARYTSAYDYYSGLIYMGNWPGPNYMAVESYLKVYNQSEALNSYYWTQYPKALQLLGMPPGDKDSQESIIRDTVIGYGYDGRFPNTAQAWKNRIFHSNNIIKHNGTGAYIGKREFTSEKTYITSNLESTNSFALNYFTGYTVKVNHQHDRKRNYDYEYMVGNVDNSLEQVALGNPSCLDCTESYFQTDWDALPTAAFNVSYVIPPIGCNSTKQEGMCNPANFPDDLKQYLQFLTKYGSHIITKINKGCTIKSTYMKKKSWSNTTEKFKAMFQGGWDGVTVEVADSRFHENIWSTQEFKTLVHSTGGELKHRIKATINILKNKHLEKLPKYMNCAKDKEEFNPTLWGMDILAQDPVMKQNMEIAIEAFLGSAILDEYEKAKEAMSELERAMGMECTQGDNCMVNIPDAEWGGGKLLRQMNVESYEECIDLCATQEECATWYVDSSYYCYLRDKASTMSSRSGSFGGINVINLYLKFYPYMADTSDDTGQTYTTYKNVASWETCQQYCIMDRWRTSGPCVAWYWNTNEGKNECGLHDKLHSFQSNKGYYMGITYMGNTPGPYYTMVQDYLLLREQISVLDNYYFKEYEPAIASMGYPNTTESDDSRSEEVITPDSALGFGFDARAGSEASGLKVRVMDSNIVSKHHGTSLTMYNYIFDSKESYENSYQNSVQVEYSYKAVSGGGQLTFGAGNQHNMNQYIYKGFAQSSLELQSMVNPACTNCFAQYFLDDLANLPQGDLQSMSGDMTLPPRTCIDIYQPNCNPADYDAALQQYFAFFNKYGTHMVHKLARGCKLDLEYTSQQNGAVTWGSFQIEAFGNAAVYTLNMPVTWDDQKTTYMQNRKVKAYAKGGDDAKVSRFVPVILSSMNSSPSEERTSEIQDWLQCDLPGQAVDMQYELVPYSSLVQSDQLRQNMLYAEEIYNADSVDERRSEVQEVMQEAVRYIGLQCTKFNVCMVVLQNGYFSGTEIAPHYKVQVYTECMSRCADLPACASWYTDNDLYCHLNQEGSNFHDDENGYYTGLNVLMLYAMFSPMKNNSYNTGGGQFWKGYAEDAWECRQLCIDQKLRADGPCRSWDFDNYTTPTSCYLYDQVNHWLPNTNKQTGLVYLGNSPGPYWATMDAYVNGTNITKLIDHFLFAQYNLKLKQVGVPPSNGVAPEHMPIDNTYTALGMGIDARYSLNINPAALKAPVFQTANVQKAPGMGQMFTANYYATQEEYVQQKTGTITSDLTYGVNVIGAFDVQWSHIDTNTQTRDHEFFVGHVSNSLSQKSILDQACLNCTYDYFQTDFNNLPTESIQSLLPTNNMIPALHCLTIDGPWCDPADYPEELQQYMRFFNKYGTHFVSKVQTGCAMTMVQSQITNSVINTNNWTVAAESKFFRHMKSGTKSFSQTTGEDLSQTKVYFQMMGGDTTNEIGITAKMLGKDDVEDATQAIADWLQCNDRNSTDSEIVYVTDGYSYLTDNAIMKQNFETAANIYMGTELYNRMMAAQKSITALSIAMTLECTSNNNCMYIQNGYSYSGTKILPHFQVTNVGQCIDECANIPACAYFYVDNKMNCHVIAENGDLDGGGDDAGYTAGINILRFYDLYYPYMDGFSIVGTSYETITTRDWNSCQKNCEADKYRSSGACIGWNFNPFAGEKNCELYDWLRYHQQNQGFRTGLMYMGNTPSPYYLEVESYLDALNISQALNDYLFYTYPKALQELGQPATADTSNIEDLTDTLLGFSYDGRYPVNEGVKHQVFQSAETFTYPGTGLKFRAQSYETEAMYAQQKTKSGQNQGVAMKSLDKGFETTHDHHVFETYGQHGVSQRGILDPTQIELTTPEFQYDLSQLPTDDVVFLQDMNAECTSLDPGNMCNPADYSEDLQAYFKFMNKWGTHLIKNVERGCRLTMTMQIQSTTMVGYNNFSEWAQTESQQLMFTGNNSWFNDTMAQLYLSQRELDINAEGGNQEKRVIYTKNSLTTTTSRDDINEYFNWMECNENHVEFDFTTVPMSYMMNGSLAKNFETAVGLYLQVNSLQQLLQAKQNITYSATKMQLQCTRSGSCLLVMPNAEFSGTSLIPKFQVTTYPDCMDTCAEVESCSTWYVDSKNYCHIMSKDATMEENYGGYGGINVLELYDKYYPMMNNSDGSDGWSYYSKAPADRWEQCQKWCEEDFDNPDGACRLWVFTSGRICQLYQNTNQNSWNTGYKTGLTYMGNVPGPNYLLVQEYLDSTMLVEELVQYIFTDYQQQLANLGVPDEGDQTWTTEPLDDTQLGMGYDGRQQFGNGIMARVLADASVTNFQGLGSTIKIKTFDRSVDLTLDDSGDANSPYPIANDLQGSHIMDRSYAVGSMQNSFSRQGIVNPACESCRTSEYEEALSMLPNGEIEMMGTDCTSLLGPGTGCNPTEYSEEMIMYLQLLNQFGTSLVVQQNTGCYAQFRASIPLNNIVPQGAFFSQGQCEFSKRMLNNNMTYNGTWSDSFYSIERSVNVTATGGNPALREAWVSGIEESAVDSETVDEVQEWFQCEDYQTEIGQQIVGLDSTINSQPMKQNMINAIATYMAYDTYEALQMSMDNMTAEAKKMNLVCTSNNTCNVLQSGVYICEGKKLVDDFSVYDWPECMNACAENYDCDGWYVTNKMDCYLMNVAGELCKDDDYPMMGYDVMHVYDKYAYMRVGWTNYDKSYTDFDNTENLACRQACIDAQFNPDGPCVSWVQDHKNSKCYLMRGVHPASQNSDYTCGVTFLGDPPGPYWEDMYWFLYNYNLTAYLSNYYYVQLPDAFAALGMPGYPTQNISYTVTITVTVTFPTRRALAQGDLDAHEDDMLDVFSAHLNKQKEDIYWDGDAEVESDTTTTASLKVFYPDVDTTRRGMLLVDDQTQQAILVENLKQIDGMQQTDITIVSVKADGNESSDSSDSSGNVLPTLIIVSVIFVVFIWLLVTFGYLRKINNDRRTPLLMAQNVTINAQIASDDGGDQITAKNCGDQITMKNFLTGSAATGTIQ